MVGLLFGTLCGAVELYLLNLFATRITKGTSVPYWIVPLKMVVLVACFVPVVLWAKNQLAHAGIAAAAILMVGAVVIFLMKKRGR